MLKTKIKILLELLNSVIIQLKSGQVKSLQNNGRSIYPELAMSKHLLPRKGMI